MDLGPYLSFLSGPEETFRAYESSYDPFLVTISIFIAIFASWVSFYLSGRMRESAKTGKGYYVWLILGALALGAGIWAMHFIGMLAFKLDCGIFYDPFITFFSMLPGVLAAAVALQVISRSTLSRLKLLGSGLVMGGGIGTMHYTGMAAMRLDGILRYDLAWFLASIVVAVLLAIIALAIRFTVRDMPFSLGQRWQQIISSVVMGSAISGMHYTAMEAAYFIPSGSQNNINPNNPTMLAWAVAAVTSLIILLALASTFASRRLMASDKRFNTIIQSMSQGLVLLDKHGSILEVNPALEVMLGGEGRTFKGEPFTRFFVGSEVRKRITTLLEQNKATEFDASLHTYSGGVLPCTVQLDIRPLTSEGDLLRFATIIRRTHLINLLGALHEGVCGLDHDGRVEVVNKEAERLIGEKETALLGKQILDRFRLPVSGNSITDGRFVFEEARQSPVSYEELQLLSTSGESRQVNFSLTSIDHSNRESGLVLVFQDVSSHLELTREMRQLRRAVEQAPVSVVITDLTGAIEYVNPHFEQVTGYHAEEVKGQNPRVLSSGLQPKSYYTELWKTISQGRQWTGVFANKRKDGSIYWEHASISPIRDGDGVSTHYIAVKEDITKRKEAEQAIERLSRYNESILNAVGDGIFGVDRQGCMTFLNPAAEKSLGWSAKELLQNPQHERIHYAHPDGEQYRPEECPVLKTTQDGVVRFVDDDTFWTRNGDAIPVEFKVAPIREESEIVGAVVVFRDISARLKAEKTLKESEERLKISLAASNTGFWDWDPVTDDAFLSDEWLAMLGYDREEINPTLQSWQALIHPDDKQKAQEALRAHLENIDSKFELELRMRHKQGYWVWILNSGRVMARDNSGSPLRMSGIHKDITDLKKAQAELEKAKAQAEEAKRQAEQASRAKTEFLATMSHEIRTPMNVILGMAELLLESEQDTERQHYLEVSHSAGEGLLALINDILDLSKIESGQLMLESQAFQVRALISEIDNIFIYPAREKGLRLTISIDPLIPEWVVGDMSRLRQVLINLTGNALKFTSRGGIDIQVEPDDQGHCLFSVKDTGIGIPDKMLDIIFKPFSQADSSISRRFGGTGLGLTICQRIIEKMKGTIRVTSVENKGSSFSFSIPLPKAKPDQHVSRAVQKKPLTEEKITSLNILIAEDAEDNITLLKAYLKNSPHQLTFVTNGLDAVQAFRQGTNYHLVLMDVQMPEMDGYTATREIRAWEQENSRSKVPIYALSAHAFSEANQHSLDAGCDGHLTKPIKKKELLAFLGGLAERMNYNLSSTN
ncbi:PAS domain S-box protein [Magnetococcus sp. PR-3]|uniref:PAS domain S-box protein n=1 Tax=Magnetococcus sp. PR-3 TaxID=3120355 RepID=UPI002FCDE6FE